MAKIRFVPNPRFQDELGDDPKFRGYLLARGIDIRKGVRGHLPATGTGGLRVAAFSRLGFAEIEGTGRDVHAVAGTKWRLGHIIEFGSATNPAYAPVRKAVRSLGLRFTENGR